MIAPDNRPAAEQMQEQIEHALTQEGIASNLGKWRLLPWDIKCSVADAVAQAFATLDEERKEQARRKNRAKALKWYQKERKRVKQLHHEIGQSDAVSNSPGIKSIVFYSFEELLCPHGWNWSYCESLGAALISLGEAMTDSGRM